MLRHPRAADCVLPYGCVVCVYARERILYDHLKFPCVACEASALRASFVDHVGVTNLGIFRILLLSPAFLAYSFVASRQCRDKLFLTA